MALFKHKNKQNDKVFLDEQSILREKMLHRSKRVLREFIALLLVVAYFVIFLILYEKGVIKLANIDNSSKMQNSLLRLICVTLILFIFIDISISRSNRLTYVKNYGEDEYSKKAFKQTIVPYVIFFLIIQLLLAIWKLLKEFGKFILGAFGVAFKDTELAKGVKSGLKNEPSVVCGPCGYIRKDGSTYYFVEVNSEFLNDDGTRPSATNFSANTRIDDYNDYTRTFKVNGVTYRFPDEPRISGNKIEYGATYVAT